MQSPRKYTLFVLTAVFVASLALVPANAQSGGISASVPFDFMLEKTVMKAGSYRIETQGAFVAIIDGQGGSRFELVLPGSYAASRDGQPYLVFTRYGTESFLSRIAFSAKETYDLPRSSREKELASHRNSGEQVAVLIGAVR